jgi:O-methyltransferase
LWVVSVRKRLNGALSQLTGYELRRASRGALGGGASAEKIPADIDEEASAIIRTVRPYTMTNVEKLNAVIMAARYITRYDIPGAVVECGVWRGGSMHAFARALDAAGTHERELYLFDTYEGMTAPGPRDRRGDGRAAADLMASYGKTSRVWAVASLEDVQEGFRQVPYPQDKVHFIKGPVEQTIPSNAPESIAVLRLDTDWYESTAHELTHLYDRLVPGGVLLLDDYGWWQGSREAVDEFMARTGARLYLARTGSGRVAIKPAD